MKRDAQKALLAAAGRYIRNLLAPIEPRLKAVEDGLGAVPALVDKAIASLPAPKDGASVTKADVEPMLREMVAALPTPKDGADGKSVGLDAVRALVTEAVAALPPPAAGRDGLDGKSVTVDEVVLALLPRFEAEIAKAVLDIERRAQGVLERAVERIPAPKNGTDGKDGNDGRDGFSLDDLTFEDDGDGTLTLRFARGDLIREKSIRYPRGDRGVYREEGEYRKDDGVTFGGSFWIAQKDAPEGRPGLSDDWRLAVKKGRDGKDGRDGIDKTAPVKL